MENNITLKNYRITVRQWSKVTTKKVAEVLMDAIDRGLYRMKDHSDLRHDLTSVYRNLQKQSDQITDEFRKELKDLVDRFNKCDALTLNQHMLNDRTITKEGFDENSEENSDLDNSDATRTNSTKVDDAKSDDKDDKSKKSDDETDSTPLSGLQNELNELRKRVDGHDRRHEETEGNLEGLNGAVGIIKDSNGAWVPVKNGMFDRNARVHNHLGYNWNEKTNTAIFADRGENGSFPFDAKTAGLTGAIAFIALLLIFWLVVGMTFSVGLFAAVPIALFVAIIVGWITADRNHN